MTSNTTPQGSANEALMANYTALLGLHDWRFAMADDHGVWRTGDAQQQALRKYQRLLDPDFKVWNSYAPKDFRVHFITPLIPAPKPEQGDAS